MATNGGIIGKTNNASFGKDEVTSKTATTTFTLQPGTRQIQALLVSGGGGGGKAYGGGGGAGGYRCVTNIQLSTNSVPLVVGEVQVHLSRVVEIIQEQMDVYHL